MQHIQPIQSKKKKHRPIVILIIMVIAGSISWGVLFPTAEPQIIGSSPMTSPLSSELTESVKSQADPIPIYLVGAVKNPGIYQVERGIYLYQLIEMAGGLLDSAAADAVNLAIRLDDNQMIRIPTLAEIIADPGAASMHGLASAGALVDLNHADESQLDALPGVGPSTAKAIVEYRKKNGPFKCIEDLMKVPGIKESRFNTLKDLVIVKG